MRILLYILFLALSASCTKIQPFVQPKQLPAEGYRYLDLLLDDPFEVPGDWRSYDNGADLLLAVVDGAYRIDFSQRQYVWSQGEGQFADLVIEAEVEQISDYEHNAFGLACRLDSGNSGRGYFFLISGDGYASIRWSNGRSLESIVPAAPSEYIELGQVSNHLRIVCIEDYLALWVNGQFVAEARDRRAGKGAVGMAAVMNYQGRRLTVAFDNLKVWRAALDKSAP